MNDEVLFYTNPMSRGRMAHWMLEEVGAPYRIELVNLEKGEQKKPTYLAINPMGKLPTIVHRGTVITETGAIIAYLADAFPAAALAPAIGEAARGAYLRWMFYAAGCIDPAIIDRLLKRAVPERTGALGYGRFEQLVDTLETALTPGPYLLGNRFTAADLYVSGQLSFGLMTQALEPRPVFQAYVARMDERPAHQRCREQSAQQMARLQAAG
jgi:glutathione S-transferase